MIDSHTQRFTNEKNSPTKLIANLALARRYGGGSPGALPLVFLRGGGNWPAHGLHPSPPATWPPAAAKNRGRRGSPPGSRRGSHSARTNRRAAWIPAWLPARLPPAAWIPAWLPARLPPAARTNRRAARVRASLQARLPPAARTNRGSLLRSRCCGSPAPLAAVARRPRALGLAGHGGTEGREEAKGERCRSLRERDHMGEREGELEINKSTRVGVALFCPGWTLDPGLNSHI